MLQVVGGPVKVIDLGDGTPNVPQVEGQMANMLAAIARHEPRLPLTLLAEGFAAVFARAAVESGSPVCWRYAIEVALDNAFARAQGPRATPPGAPVAA